MGQEAVQDRKTKWDIPITISGLCIRVTGRDMVVTVCQALSRRARSIRHGAWVDCLNQRSWANAHPSQSRPSFAAILRSHRVVISYARWQHVLALDMRATAGAAVGHSVARGRTPFQSERSSTVPRGRPSGTGLLRIYALSSADMECSSDYGR